MTTLTWTRESRPVWDADKERVVAGAPTGALDVPHEPGGELAGDWFAAADGSGRVVGYGWLDSTWGGDTEILLAVDPACEGTGVGSFVLQAIEQEAAARGSNYVFNTVRDSHPHRDDVRDWLLVRGYRGDERDATLRKRVGPVDPRSHDEEPARAAHSSTGPVRAPGHEETGGYVDVEQHRY